MLTGAHMQIVRDNFAETAVAKATQSGSIFAGTGTNSIAERIPQTDTRFENETSTSTTYAALTTAGPVITITSGTRALIGITCILTNNTIGARSFASYDVSGATSVAANDNWSLCSASAVTSGNDLRATSLTLWTSLTSGSNTFTAKYRVSGGTGGFDERDLLAIPF